MILFFLEHFSQGLKIRKVKWKKFSPPNSGKTSEKNHFFQLFGTFRRYNRPYSFFFFCLKIALHVNGRYFLFIFFLCFAQGRRVGANTPPIDVYSPKQRHFNYVSIYQSYEFCVVRGINPILILQRLRWYFSYAHLFNIGSARVVITSVSISPQKRTMCVFLFYISATTPLIRKNAHNRFSFFP